ncbi:hypothetical protein [Treponema primitia]|uniref:hypothetical protein n=1 Tax=Treponema primitia TaxID=88058 RepID=UPI00068522A9|nr:hypothetical protein [Treponema primitia]
MRIKVTSIIAVISIVLYAAAIGTGVIRIITGINERRNIAQREFYDLADIASSAGVLGFMEEPFKDAVRDAVTGSKTIQGVIVTGPFGAEFTFERDNNGIITWEGENPRFQRRFGVSRNPHFAPLRVDGLRNATITAVSNDINYPAFTLVLKQSLLMILAAILLSAVTLLISSITNKKAESLVSDKMQKIYPTPEKAPPLSRSNAAGESHTKEKLDLNLRICSAAEQDLTLILMELSLTAGFGVGDDSIVYRKFIDRALQFFTDQDLIFERGDRGISIILPNSNLDESFAKAKQFHNQILTSLPEIFPHKSDLRIGISARSGRLLGADRLLLEASKALEKTGLEPESPIIAFKSDPEKYRAFVKNHGKK